MSGKTLTLGSLFDGIGSVPLAAFYYGIKPLWASEILPSAISVTRRHFPDMAHVGDITKINGADLPPADIVAFGSPCQGASVAGNRKGLADERSGLFLEAIRVINEMREATDGRYPRFAVWENVPGFFTSNNRLDYKAVLEAFTKTEVSIPQSGRWANAGMVRGNGVDIAWCVYNAQYFGVPQRRRRIFLIVDFGGRRAGEILFVPKSLQGYFAAGGAQGKGSAAHASRGINGKVQGGLGLNCLTPWDTQQARIFDVNGASPTLAGADNGGGGNPAGLVFSAFCGGAAASAGSMGYSEKVSPTLKSSTSGSNRTPCVCVPATARTLTAKGVPGDSSDSGPNLVVEAYPAIARTLTARGDSSPCADRGQNIVALPIQQDLCATANKVLPNVSGTLCASGAGLSRPAGMASETDLCVVTAIDCRNLKENQDISGTLQAKNTPGYSLNYLNPIRSGYTVRRLTPTECERLMGLPDGWTEYGHDGKRISDTKRYQMLGNSIVVPCVAYIMQGIIDAYNDDNQNMERK